MRTLPVIAILLTTGIGGIGGPQPTPIRWSAEQPQNAAVKPGQDIVVRVSAQIDEGWHLYALEAIPGGPIPTRIGVAPDPPFTLNEKHIESPEPKRAHDPNFGLETAYYEQTATFGVPVTVGAKAPAGSRDVEISARFQACNDQICLRPQTATMRVKVDVRP